MIDRSRLQEETRKKFAEAGEAVGRAALDFLGFAVQIVTAPDPIKAARRAIDDYRSDVIQESPVRPRCGVGCAGCCHGPVPVWRSEALRIRAVAAPAVLERARAMAALDSSDPELLRIPCPALDPIWKTCTVYAERPITCRAHMSFDDPIDCEPGGAGARNDIGLSGFLAAILHARTDQVVILADVLAEEP